MPSPLRRLDLSLTDSLRRAPPWLRNSFAIGAAFTTYFCMYAFRKPFAAGTFDEASVFGSELGFKSTLVISQIVGYALSKFLGARFLPRLANDRRTAPLIGLVLAAWLVLVGFGVAGSELRILLLFLNGLFLGMIWGLVVGPLEGRRNSELLLAGLSCSFIVASGVVKDVGRALMNDAHVSEGWMPAMTGLLFLPPFLVAAWMLGRVPKPTVQDEQERTRRIAMGSTAQREFSTRFALPLGLLLVVYFLLTAFRDYRDNYGVELFAALGYADEPALFTSSEVPVAIGVLIVLAILSLLRNNRVALGAVFAVMSLGLLLLSGATYLLQAGFIGGLAWMILTGLGSYLTYVPFGSVLFDRILAHTRFAGTAVFGIYLADAVGYTGSVSLQLYAELSGATSARLDFLLGFTHLLAWLGAALLLFSGLLWLRSGDEMSSRNKNI